MLRRPAKFIVPVGLFMALLLSSAGCSSVPEDERSSQAALLANPPKELLSRIDLSFRKKIALSDAKDINAYLTKVSSRLFGITAHPATVTLVSSTTAGYRPTVWVIPGGRIYIDIRILRSLQFENELASGMVLAWELSEGSEFRERLIQEGGKATPDPEKIWTFSELEYQRAIEAAVDRIYKAGYDPRGLVTYFTRTAEKRKNAQEVETLKEKARRTIAFYAPLLNPIVRTEDFYKMKKRLERL